MVILFNIEYEVELCFVDFCVGVVGKDFGDIFLLDLM